MTTPEPENPYQRPPHQIQPGEQAMTDVGHPMAAAPPSAPQDRVYAWIALGAGAAAVVASLFLPWVVVSAPFVGSRSLYGTEGDGWITAAAAAVLVAYGITALRGRPHIAFKVAALLTSLSLVGIGLWKVRDLRTREAEARALLTSGQDDLGFGASLANAVDMQVGMGLWLLILAGVAGAVAINQTLWKRNRKVL